MPTTEHSHSSLAELKLDIVVVLSQLGESAATIFYEQETLFCTYAAAWDNDAARDSLGTGRGRRGMASGQRWGQRVLCPGIWVMVRPGGRRVLASG